MRGIHEKGPSGPRNGKMAKVARGAAATRPERRTARLGVYSLQVQRLAGARWKATVIGGGPGEEGRLSYTEKRLVDALDAITDYIILCEDGD